METVLKCVQLNIHVEPYIKYPCTHINVSSKSDIRIRICSTIILFFKSVNFFYINYHLNIFKMYDTVVSCIVIKKKIIDITTTRNNFNKVILILIL